MNKKKVSLERMMGITMIFAMIYVPILVLAFLYMDTNNAVSYNTAQQEQMIDVIVQQNDVIDELSASLLALDARVSSVEETLGSGDIVRVITATLPPPQVTVEPATPTPIPTAEPTISQDDLMVCLGVYTLGDTPANEACPSPIDSVKLTIGNIYYMSYDLRLNCVYSEIDGKRNISICPEDVLLFAFGDGKNIPSKTLRKLKEECSRVSDSYGINQPVCQEIMEK